jgi:hypothetical protein
MRMGGISYNVWLRGQNNVCCLLPGLEQQTQHARNIPIVVCAAPAEDEQVVLEKCTGR